jgi:hypothetical protein
MQPDDSSGSDIDKDEGSGEPLRLRVTGLEWREVEGEVVALDAIGSQYLGVNATGGLLWSRLGAGVTREELIELLVEECGATSVQASRDVDAFLEDLRLHRLLQ